MCIVRMCTYMLFANSSYVYFLPFLPRVDYACIPQPSCKTPLQESLIPVEVSRVGSFFASFNNVAKSFRTIPNTTDGDARPTAMIDDDETKGEPRRTNTTDHRHKSATSEGSSAKHWLGEAVKVSAHPHILVLLKEILVGGSRWSGFDRWWSLTCTCGERRERERVLIEFSDCSNHYTTAAEHPSIH